MLFKLVVCVLFVSQMYAMRLELVSDKIFVTTQVPENEAQVETTPESVREGRSIDNELYKNKDSAIEDALLRKLDVKCNQKEISSCVMLQLVVYMNHLLKKSSIHFTDSVEITQTSPVFEEEIKKEDLEIDESKGFIDKSVFTRLISEKVLNFLKSRSFKWNVLPETDVIISPNTDKNGSFNMGIALRSARSVGTGRGKNKNAGPLIAVGIMKIGLLKVLALKALALLVGKALLLSKLAFLLAVVIGLKKLLSGHKHVTYEVVPHPHHVHSTVESHGHEDSYSSGWGRSGDAAMNLAYRGHFQ